MIASVVVEYVGLSAGQSTSLSWSFSGIMPPAAVLAGLPLVEGTPSSGRMEDQASRAAATLNLLPLASASPKLPATGTYIGDGMPPVPSQLTVKILWWEFVEMGELLLEFWAGHKDSEGEKE